MLNTGRFYSSTQAYTHTDSVRDKHLYTLPDTQGSRSSHSFPSKWPELTLLRFHTHPPLFQHDCHKHKLCSQIAWVISSLLHLLAVGSWANYLTSVPQFPALQGRAKNCMHIIKLIWNVNELIDIKCLEQCLAHSECFVCIGLPKLSPCPINSSS